ncbi:MAG: Stk1 family PASTA domain-containing Ser/Thr kinase [Propionibacteriaceae bacterium]|jgi:serine/threonine-protein kinase|nr:Stk1 family PASTA domain-containing Ser/Thr kinase [Propionibacteriaceae bacterium]
MDYHDHRGKGADVSVSQGDSLIGSVLGGRYEIVAKISRGGTAVVYRGIDRRLGRTVAVKIIHSDLSGDPDYVKRFDREARAAAILSHPNIVAVFDQGRTGDRAYIVMEYIHGQSLRSIISSSAPLPAALALTYAHEMSKALAAAHDATIIHRDIKPENVLITNDGGVKITDFGLAKSITQQTSTASQGLIMGTMSYIAPEIPQSGSALVASDIYSFGIVLYEMLTGKKPHTGEDLSAVLYKHVHEDIPPPSRALVGQARARIPDYVDALVVACTSRDPARRPANGRVLEEKLAKARQALEAGRLHDAALVDEFSGRTGEPERTPVAPTVVPGPAKERTTPERRRRGEPAGNGPTRPAGTPEGRTGAGAAGTAKLTKAPPGRPPRRRWWLLVLILVIIGALLSAGGYGAWYAFVGRWTHVPEITGKTELDARTLTEADGLTFEALQEYSETVAAGLVIRTDPAGGARVKRESPVTAFVSKGQERYAMPTVVGLPVADAETALLNANLAVGTTTEDWSESVATGLVISATHAPGDMLQRNTAIDLVVSKGRQPIAIPSVKTQAVDAAKSALEAAGFAVAVTTADSSGGYDCAVAPGTVVDQSPADGTGYLGDTINLVVQGDPPKAAIPDVKGKTRATARSLLGQAGFGSVTEKNASMIGISLGLAVTTDPGPGQSVSVCTTITLSLV